MPIAVTVRTTVEHDRELGEMLSGSEWALMHYGPEYRNFLQQILTGSEPVYLLAREDGRLVGAFPSFVKRNTSAGNVVNSLPFYGSHGGPWVSEQARDPLAVGRALAGEFENLVSAEKAVSATVVANPLDGREWFAGNGARKFVDKRIGQFTRLPALTGSTERDMDALFARFHLKTRNAIRKAQKSGLRVHHSNSAGALTAVAELHSANMAALGGIAKPLQVFEAISGSFRYDDEYRVYLAELDGRVIAALLVLYQYRVAEYFVPATLEEFRHLQPMSLLITEAMLEAVRRGYRLWNWGGTWESQEGVYRFKSRMGAEDLPYRYHTTITDEGLLKRTKEDLLGQYPYFYVVPFSALEVPA